MFCYPLREKENGEYIDKRKIIIQLCIYIVDYNTYLRILLQLKLKLNAIGTSQLRRRFFCFCSSFAVSYTHLTLPTIYSV